MNVGDFVKITSKAKVNGIQHHHIGKIGIIKELKYIASSDVTVAVVDLPTKRFYVLTKYLKKV